MNNSDANGVNRKIDAAPSGTPSSGEATGEGATKNTAEKLESKRKRVDGDESPKQMGRQNLLKRQNKNGVAEATSKAKAAGLKRNPYFRGLAVLGSLSDSELFFLGIDRESASTRANQEILELLAERRNAVISRKKAMASEEMSKTLSMLCRAGTPLAVVVRVLWQLDQLEG